MTKLALVNITRDMECAPLGLVYMATYLKKNMNIKIHIVDINFENPLKAILKLRPDVVGISSISLRYNFARKLARKIKKKLNIPIIIGGVHISTCPESFDKIFDVGVIGEGEKTMLELMKLFQKKGSFVAEDLEKVEGIIFYNNKLIMTKRRELIKNLDKIPIPNRNLLDSRYFLPRISYNRLRGEKVREAGIITSRGCPYKCIFCSTSAFWTRIRFHSADYVVKEIKQLVNNFGINFIVIYDDLFSVNIKRIKEIYKKLKKEKIIGKVKFACSLRANFVNEDLCKLLKKLGVVTVNFGFESGSEKILRYLKGESVTVEQNKKAVLLCRKHGFDVNGSFMLGSPGEKIKDMRKTLGLMEWMKKQGAIELWCGVTKPYPSTQLWEYGLRNKLFDKNFNWDVVDPSYPHNPVFLDRSISKKEFLKIFRKAKEKSFSMSVQKRNPIIRKIKDFIYYNKFLYDIVRKIKKWKE